MPLEARVRGPLSQRFGRVLRLGVGTEQGARPRGPRRNRWIIEQLSRSSQVFAELAQSYYFDELNETRST